MAFDKEFRIYSDKERMDGTLFSSSNRYVIQSATRVENTIRQIRKEIQGAAILDIGASPFYFLYRCQALGAKSASGVFFTNDLHPLKEKDKAYTRFGEINLAHIDVLREPLPYPDNFFDVVGAMEIFEHFPEFPRLLLSEITRVIKKRGTFFLTVPNSCRIGNIVKPLLRRNVFMKYRNDPFGRHAHEYTRQQVKDLLTESVGGINVSTLPIVNRANWIRKALTIPPFSHYTAPIWFGTATVERILGPDQIGLPSSIYEGVSSVEI